MMMWKIVGVSEVSVIYIYIYIDLFVDFFFYSFYPTMTHSRSPSQLPLNSPTFVSTPSELSPLCLTACLKNMSSC